jgi:hypothetical protein
MIGYAEDLRETVTRAGERLLMVSEADAARRPGPGKWSAKEIIGHLVDSAANNHQRFVRAQFQDDLIFTGYAQAEWVQAQRYQDAPWQSLVVLWREYNVHLARVMDATPETVRLRERRRHNLQQIALNPVAEHTPATLDYLMRDYVVHLHHHLRQVSGLLRLEF